MTALCYIAFPPTLEEIYKIKAPRLLLEAHEPDLVNTRGWKRSIRVLLRVLYSLTLTLTPQEYLETFLNMSKQLTNNVIMRRMLLAIFAARK